MRLRLSFETGFILDGLPGWREVLSLPPTERLRALADPATRRHLDERAHSPEAGMLAGLANWSILEIVETFAPENAGLVGRRVARRWPTSAASSRSTRCSTSCAPTSCAPG